MIIVLFRFVKSFDIAINASFIVLNVLLSFKHPYVRISGGNYER